MKTLPFFHSNHSFVRSKMVFFCLSLKFLGRIQPLPVRTQSTSQKRAHPLLLRKSRTSWFLYSLGYLSAIIRLAKILWSGQVITCPSGLIQHLFVRFIFLVVRLLLFSLKVYIYFIIKVNALNDGIYQIIFHWKSKT